MKIGLPGFAAVLMILRVVRIHPVFLLFILFIVSSETSMEKSKDSHPFSHTFECGWSYYLCLREFLTCYQFDILNIIENLVPFENDFLRLIRLSRHRSPV